MALESPSPATIMSIEEYSRKVLLSSSFFNAFTPEDLEGLVPFSQLLFFDKGEVIIQQGDAEDHHVYFLRMGKVSVYADEKYILSLERPGDIFGEMSLCSSAPRSASVIADELVEVLSIDAAIIHDPRQQENYKFKYFFYNMFASIMSWKLETTTKRAKLYEDEFLKTQQTEKYSQGLERRLQENLEQMLLYSHLVNSTHEGILIMNVEGIVTLSNPSIDKLFEIEDTQMIGFSFDQFIEFSPESSSSFESILQSGQTAEGWSGEIQLLRSDNKKIPALLTVSSVTNHQDETIALSCVIRDISDQKAYESQILQQKQELEEAYTNLQTLDKLKDDFLTLMSHEFRTPLTSILGYAETLSTPDLVDVADQATFLSAIYDQAQRLNKLLANVLNLSKLESGQLFFSFLADNLGEVVEEVVRHFLPQAEEKGLTLKYELPSSPLLFNFDRERIKEVIEHILENALQFTEKGMISVRMFNQSTQTVVQVTDSGPGIAEKDYAKVFNKFELIEEMAYHHRGLGLGMPLSRLIIEMHQGRIWIESVLNQGSTFFFALPHDLEMSSENTESEEADEDFSHLL